MGDLWVLVGPMVVVGIGFLISIIRARMPRPEQVEEEIPTRSMHAQVGAKKVTTAARGYTYCVTFLSDEGARLELITTEEECKALQEGAKGTVTFSELNFVSFTEDPEEE